MGLITHRISLAGCLLILILSGLHAQPRSLVLSETDTILYRNQDSTFYYQKPERIVELYGQASVKYEDIELTAGYIRIHVDSQTLLAQAYPNSDSIIADDDPENPVLIQGSDKIYGRRILYNLKTKRGKVIQGQSKMDNGFYHGNEILSVDKKEIYLDQSHYSTCNLVPQKQHYYFQIRDVKVLPKDKILARHIVFYLNRVPFFYLPMQTGLGFQDSSGYCYLPKIPVFYLPLLMFPIRRDRHSGLLMPKIGQERIGGRDMYVIRETGYYWAINDYTDNLSTINFYNSNNFKLENDFRYNLRYILNGNLNTSYYHSTESSEWSLNLSHSQTLTPSLQLTATANYVSSSDYLQKTSDDLEDRLNRQMNSSVLLNQRLGFGSLNLNLYRSENLDTKVTEQKLPAFGFNLSSREVKGFYISYSNKALYYQYEDTLLTKKRYGATHTASVTRTDKIKTYLRLNHSLTLNEYWFDKAYNADSTENTLVRKMNYSYSLNLGNTLYGVFAPNLFGIKAIRHKVDPSVGFSYTPADRDSSILYNNFPSVSYYPNRIGSQSLTFKVANLFQMKSSGKKSKENPDQPMEEKRTDLFSVDFSTNYNFVDQGGRWSDLQTSFRMKPLNNINITISASHDPYNDDSTHVFQNIPRMKNLRFSNSNTYNLAFATLPVWGLFIPIPWLINKTKSSTDNQLPSHPQDSTAVPLTGTAALFSKDWHGQYSPEFKLSITHNFSLNQITQSYGKKTTTRIHTVNLTATWNMTPRWTINYNTNIDLIARDILNHNMVLKSDLHCWEFMFRYQESPNYRQFYWIINIKDIPDIKIEQLRRTY